MTAISITPDTTIHARADRKPSAVRTRRSLIIGALALGLAGAAGSIAAGAHTSHASSTGCPRVVVAWPSGDATSPPAWPSAGTRAGIDMFAAAGPVVSWPNGDPASVAWPAAADQSLRCL